MNLIEAVRELKENKDAEAVIFYTKAGEYRRLILIRPPGADRKFLGYPSGVLLKANDPAFILREDFEVEYKNGYRKLTTSEIKIKVAELLEELERRTK